MKKYKLKLDYTADELEELKRLSKDYNNPMGAVSRVAYPGYQIKQLKHLWDKYFTLDNHKEFDLMVDINNVVMGTAIFPEEKYVVHDKFTDQYVCFMTIAEIFCWSPLQIPEKKTKDEWLAINPAYEPMLERVEDDE